MNISGQHLAYFSATHTTRDLVRRVGKTINLPIVKEHNLAGRANQEPHEVVVAPSELLIIGVPSYYGRVPELVVPYVQQFKGDDSPAILLCAYGNRDFEDTLLELSDLISAQGFNVIAAGGFVATHSIFSQVGAGRPDATDLSEQTVFAEHCLKLLEQWNDVEHNVAELTMRGNHPYRAMGTIPFYPTGNSKCDECGTCVKLCPTGAISEKNPKKTDKEKCITCGRCITVCPQHARANRSLIFKIARKKFVGAHQDRQANATYFIGD